jgi:DNA-binding HxlR family transcriptional regulator
LDEQPRGDRWTTHRYHKETIYAPRCRTRALTSTLAEEAELKCPYGKLLEVLGKPHTLAILYSFGVASPMRFTKLQKSLGLQPKILAARLHELVGFGLLERKAYNEIPPRVEYELSSGGRDLKKMFEMLQDWSDRHQVVRVPQAAAVPRRSRSL